MDFTGNGAGVREVRLYYVRLAHAHIKPNGSIMFPNGAFNQISRFYCRVHTIKFQFAFVLKYKVHTKCPENICRNYREVC
jgi:hypothetical protein